MQGLPYLCLKTLPSPFLRDPVFPNLSTKGINLICQDFKLFLHVAIHCLVNSDDLGCLRRLCQILIRLPLESGISILARYPSFETYFHCLLTQMKSTKPQEPLLGSNAPLDASNSPWKVSAPYWVRLTILRVDSMEQWSGHASSNTE